MENVVISPRTLCDVTGRETMVDLFVANLSRWREASLLDNVVDKRLVAILRERHGLITFRVRAFLPTATEERR